MSGRTNEPKSLTGKEATEKSGPSLPPIFFPKGGTGSTTVPIYASPSHSGIGPQFSFSAYAVTVVAVGGAIIATLELGSAMKHSPTLFFCAVFLSGWIGGLWPGIFACLLSAIALDYYFIPPLCALGIGLEEAPDMIAFVVPALIISWLSGERKRANDVVRKACDELHARICERSSKLGQTKDQLQLGTAGPKIVEDDLTLEHVDVTGVAGNATVGEPAAPIAHELSAKIGKVEELVHEFEARTPAPERTEVVSLNGAREFVAHPPPFCPLEESVFFKQGDYWTIHYQGQIARLKATRGLQCLASLLRHPDREFHVSELIAGLGDEPVASVPRLASGTCKEGGNQVWAARLQDAGPILDARAKTEYRRRLADLQGELEDAERLNDPERAGRAREERDYIADQLAVAVGLGGRNRRAASQAERARSTVTKRIKDSIDKIAEAMPPLGRHLAARIKTGYFCSYRPNPDRPVKWKMEF